MREVENSYIISPQTEYGKLPGRKVPKVGVVSQARVNLRRSYPSHMPLTLKRPGRVCVEMFQKRVGVLFRVNFEKVNRCSRMMPIKRHSMNTKS